MGNVMVSENAVAPDGTGAAAGGDELASDTHSIAEVPAGVKSWPKLLDHLMRGGRYTYYWTKVDGDNGQKRTIWFLTTKPSPVPSGDVHVYYGVNPTGAAKSESERASIADIVAVNCLFADFDFKDFGGDKRKCWQHIHSLPVFPSVIVATGGGYHCYWLFIEPFLIVTPGDLGYIRDLQRRWVAFVGADTGASDLARVLRVPGTRNVKAEYAPRYRRVGIVWGDDGNWSLYAPDFLAEHLPAPAAPAPSPQSAPDRGAPRLDDAELLDKARAAVNGAAFDALYGGAVPAGKSHSDADMALCMHLAFWTAKDAGAMDRLFRGSGLMREKWDERHSRDGRTYGQMTIDKAIAQTTETYSGKATRPATQTAPQTTPAPAPEPAEPAGDELPTDMGNARRLARRHGADMRFTAGAGWLCWDGLRWVRDETGQAIAWAKETAGAMFDEAEGAQHAAAELVRDVRAAAGNDEELARAKERLGKAEKRAAGLLRWALASQGRGRIEAMLALAQSEPGIAAEDRAFDGDAWLLNCQNGTIDLRTGELRDHDRRDLITKLAPVKYDPAARLDAWDKYLADATQGDGDLSAYLQRAAGYTLTGLVSEEVFFVALGPPASGKTTLAEALIATLGNYAHKASFDSFLQSDRVGGNSDDLADMAGARLVVAAEGTDRHKLALGRVKELSGGDTIRACRKYQAPFSYKPQFKLWLASNRMPGVDDMDGAIWRRLRRLPFEHSIPEEARDPAIKAALCDPTIGGPAILAWAVAGCLAWRRAGLGTPDIVRRKSAELRESMDPLRDWIAECCTLDGNAFAGGGALRASFDAWQKAHGGGRDSLSSREWAERLTALGCRDDRLRIGGKSARGWRGIGLLSEDDDNEPGF